MSFAEFGCKDKGDFRQFQINAELFADFAKSLANKDDKCVNDSDENEA